MDSDEERKTKKVILIVFGIISIINGLPKSTEKDKFENFNDFLKKIKDDFDKDPNCPDCKLNGQYHIVKLNKEHRILNLWSSANNGTGEEVGESQYPNNLKNYVIKKTTSNCLPKNYNISIYNIPINNNEETSNNDEDSFKQLNDEKPSDHLKNDEDSFKQRNDEKPSDHLKNDEEFSDGETLVEYQHHSSDELSIADKAPRDPLKNDEKSLNGEEESNYRPKSEKEPSIGNKPLEDPLEYKEKSLNDKKASRHHPTNDDEPSHGETRLEYLQKNEKPSIAGKPPNYHFTSEEKSLISDTQSNYAHDNNKAPKIGESGDKQLIDRNSLTYKTLHVEHNLNNNESEDCTEDKSDSSIGNCNSSEESNFRRFHSNNYKSEVDNKSKRDQIDVNRPNFGENHVFYTKWKLSN